MLGQMVRGAKPNSAALIPNPFYHAWRAGALGAGGDIVMLNATAETGYLPDLDTLDDACLIEPQFSIFARHQIRMALMPQPNISPDY